MDTALCADVRLTIARLAELAILLERGGAQEKHHQDLLRGTVRAARTHWLDLPLAQPQPRSGRSRNVVRLRDLYALALALEVEDILFRATRPAYHPRPAMHSVFPRNAPRILKEALERLPPDIRKRCSEAFTGRAPRARETGGPATTATDLVAMRFGIERGRVFRAKAAIRQMLTPQQPPRKWSGRRDARSTRHARADVVNPNTESLRAKLMEVLADAQPFFGSIKTDLRNYLLDILELLDPRSSTASARDARP